jgi:23S rRNA (adenine2503-C2)-methyltransferase
MENPFIYNLGWDDLSRWVKETAEPAYRVGQIWKGLYVQLYDKPDQFTMLPAPLRYKLGETFRFNHLSPMQILDSRDRETQKIYFCLPDGNGIEAVRMGYRNRQTLCISTQAGCGMGCVFCATGQMGFRRHLSSGEIIEQVLFFARKLRQQNKKVTNVVVMGMGEPFHNYDATMFAIDCLNHIEGYNFGARRFTISTVGLVPMIHRFASERRQINLAVSLHAAEDDLRTSMLPINKRYGIDELLQACKEYVQLTHRRITFEWALIEGVNDTPQQAQRLASKLKGLLCHVNAIPLNPTHLYSGKAASRERAVDFQANLKAAGIPCTIRLRRGLDIQAGCGQLAIGSTPGSC